MAGSEDGGAYGLTMLVLIACGYLALNFLALRALVVLLDWGSHTADFDRELAMENRIVDATSSESSESSASGASSDDALAGEPMRR